MSRSIFSDLQLEKILDGVVAQHPKTALIPNLFGQLTEIPRHIWKMGMKEEIGLINDSKK